MIHVPRACLKPTILLLAYLTIVVPAAAQSSATEDSLTVPQLPVGGDQPIITAEDVQPGLTMTKSPGLAVGLSAILPGAGQFYNESYWKVPIVLGLGAYFVSGWVRNDNLADDYRMQYEDSKTEEDPDGNTTLLATRDFYKNQRDTFVWYFVILYVANLVDAYVDANLYDFDVGETLTLRVLPEMSRSPDQAVGLGFRIQF
jgi:hypothetical protein